ncbi:serine hydrolase domain-containing protein [Thiomicrolovo sp. ZZH C-3]
MSKDTPYHGRKIRLRLLIPFLLLLMPAWHASHRAFAKEKPRSNTSSDLPHAFQTALDDCREKYGFPGATAAYMLPDGTLSVAATGYADAETAAPMKVHSRMLAASIGKTFVSAAAVALSLEGTLDLDAPISQWLGGYSWFARLPNHDALTLRYLLNHRGGLPDHVHMERFTSAVSREWQKRGNPFPPERLLRFILDRPPLFNVGEGWAYSDTGYILVGLVIEAATKKRYYDLIDTRFLKPLGLTLTGPSDRRRLPGLAPGYTAADNPFGFPGKTTRTDGSMQWHPGLEWTGGGLVSSSRDLVRWGAALFGGEAISGPYLDILLNAGPIRDDSADVSYGAGIVIRHTGPFGPVYGHDGWIPGYCSALSYYPEYGITVALQINTDIGIVDKRGTAMQDIKTRLADIVIQHTSRRPSSACNSKSRSASDR